MTDQITDKHLEEEQAKTAALIADYLKGEPTLEELRSKQEEIQERKKNRAQDRRDKEALLARDLIPPLKDWKVDPVPAPEQVAISYQDLRLAIYNQYKLRLKVKGKEPVFTADQKTIIQNLIKYFVGDPTSIYKLHKGLYIFGNYGRGKSLLMRIIKDQIDTYLETAKRDGSYTITNLHPYKYLTYEGIMDKVKADKSTHRLRNMAASSICLDDLGYMEETKINLFGNKSDLVVKLVKTLNEYHVRRGIIHHFTSNLGPSLLKRNHGEGTSSRIVEMCNIIHWDGPDNLREQ